MKVIARNLKELKEANLPDVYNKVYSGLNTYVLDDELDENILEDDFQITLGGHFYLVEKPEDLSEIYTAKLKSNIEQPSYYNLNESPGVFDICEYSGDVVYIMMCTHNGGGNTYLVPIEIAEACPNVIKSIELTAIGYV